MPVVSSSLASAALRRPTPELMPASHVLGGGRDRAFDVPQFFVRLRGVKTAFCDSGGPGEALLFIHGLAGNLTHFVNVAPLFCDHYRVLGIDLPGHGESDKPGTYSIQMFVRHLIALLDALDIPQVTLVGHSMGGMVATAATIACPDRISAAVLINPAGMQPMPWALQVGGRLVLRERLLAPILPRVWRGILANVFYRKNRYTERFVRTCQETYDPADVLPMARVMESLSTDLISRDYAALLSQIQTPVGLIWGQKDRLVPASYLHEAARTLANVTAEEIAECGHMPIIEQPYRVVRFIERVLAQQAHVAF